MNSRSMSGDKLPSLISSPRKSQVSKAEQLLRKTESNFPPYEHKRLKSNYKGITAACKVTNMLSGITSE